MIKSFLLPAMLVSTMVFASSLLAEEEKCSEKCSKCPAGATGECLAGAKCPVGAKGDCSDCPVTAAMNKLPKITFAVGETKTCCPKTASKLAKEQATDIVYLVGKEKFTDADKAKLALVSATEKFVDSFANPHVCKVSGTTTIAGQKTQCSKTAAKLAGLVTEATKNIHLTFVVGEKTCDCPHAAASLAKSTGKPKLFVVGKEKTECEVTARLNLARAKYRAVVEALVKAENETESEAETETESKES